MVDQRNTAASNLSPSTIMRIVSIGAGLPALIAATNYRLLAEIGQGGETRHLIVLQAAWYVTQVGIVGIAVGRGIENRLLRWVVFGWLMLLIDLLAWLQASTPAGPTEFIASTTAALYGGQIGLCIVWAFLGDTKWLLRWPAMLAMGAMFFALWRSVRVPSPRIWTELLVLNVFTLSVLCWLLERARFRVQVAHADASGGLTAADVEDRQRGIMQFGIKHMLLWMTVLAVFLGVAKAFDLLNSQAVTEFMRGGMWKLTVATTSAMTMVVALWIALGQGHWLLRYALGLTIFVLLGCGLSLWSLRDANDLNRMLNGPAQGVWHQSYFELLRWYQVGWWWLGWLFLTGGLLAATLLILRARGYRLLRVRPAPVQ